MEKSKPNDDLPDLTATPSQFGEVVETNQVEQDAVFGQITEGGPNYRNVGWIGTTFLMLKTQIGLGVLSIPSVFHTIGLIPGVLVLLIVAAITTWSGYVVGTFKLRHRQVYGMDDVGELLFGRVGREVFGAAFCLMFTFVSASAMLSISIALNALSTHAICTAGFVAVAAVVTFSLSSIRTLGRISWLAWVGAICILVAVFTVTIAVGLQDRPFAAPKTDDPWKSDYELFNKPSFLDAASAISAIVFAYSGPPVFLPIVSEMRDPRQYTKSLLVCQSIVTITFVTIGVVVYYYCGSYVSSPALGSAGPIIKKVAYGIGLPGLLVSAILLTHISAKYLFIRILRNSTHLTSNSPTHWMTWIGSTLSVSIVAYLIASGIPIFDTLISLIGALLGTSLCFQPMGAMWLYDNWSAGKSNPTWKWRFMVAWSAFVIVSGFFLTVAGTWGSISIIIDSFKMSGGTSAWSCADNSNSA